LEVKGTAKISYMARYLAEYRTHRVIPKVIAILGTAS
jgi:hypothetical protein